MSREAETRQALVIATGRYADPKFQQLRAPEADARALATVLADPAIGDFGVHVAIDEEQPHLLKRIARFFTNRHPDDLLFLHVSGHGVRDDHGDLYFAATDTEFDLLSATAISAGWLNQLLSRTRSRRTVVLLDCCFSGSFPLGARARAGADVNVTTQFEGAGRGLAVITASSAMEYAYEGDQLSGEGQPSFFTEAVVEGLRSGKADRDQDRWISVDDLYRYVHESVRTKTPSQTPNMKSELEGPLYIARSVYEPPVEPKQLSPELMDLSESPFAGARLTAVEELTKLLRATDPGVALTARETLERMVDDDSRRVSAAAKTSLTRPDEEEKAAREAEEKAAGEAEEQARREAEQQARREAEEQARRGAEEQPRGEVEEQWVASNIERQEDVRQTLSVGEAIRVRHDELVRAVTFSPDNQLIATGSEDATVRLWHVNSGSQEVSLTHPKKVRTVAFSPDGRQLGVGGGNVARVLELAGGQEILTARHGGWMSEVRSVAWSPTGSLFALGGTDKKIQIWEMYERRESRPALSDRGFENYTETMAFSPNGKWIASAGRWTRVWEINTGRELVNSESHRGITHAVAFSPDGLWIATGSDEAAHIKSIDDGQETGRFEHPEPVTGLAFSPDGRHLLTGSTNHVVGTLRIWRVEDGSELLAIDNLGFVTAVAFSADGRHIACAAGSAAWVWEVSEVS